MPGGMGDCAAMPRPLAKMEINSSQSTAMEIAWRSFLAFSGLQGESLRLSPLPLGEGLGDGALFEFSHAPPTTGSSQLNPRYMVEVATEVESAMPCLFIASVTLASPLTLTCTAWSKLSELMPEAS